ncbi:hypothetical protein BK133_11290 [Paenibacillus sp. FSL H8-0548]|uniref:hypothetical protein n=1 Tax=Paenibacillus sp. FSL H8-0548 TaxID=1920422 RepID=UPI00096EB43D|nr:hypothetical protein [Paenibacillus sp. FSL H8-0548]OMF35280.1 hypothetical protein BK133_11290 [Paenibacillus sp. FSL H8-0548]
MLVTIKKTGNDLYNISTNDIAINDVKVKLEFHGRYIERVLVLRATFPEGTSSVEFAKMFQGKNALFEVVGLHERFNGAFYVGDAVDHELMLIKKETVHSEGFIEARDSFHDLRDEIVKLFRLKEIASWLELKILKVKGR